MPAVRPLWTFPAGGEPDFVGFHAGHAIVIEDEHVSRIRLTDGAVVAATTLPGCGSLFPAMSGRWFLSHDPITGPGPSGLLVHCYGGTGLAPVHFAAMIDPATLAVRWRIDGGATYLDPVAERDGLVPIETSSYRAPLRVLGVDAATGAIRWTSAPLGANAECTDLVHDPRGVYHFDCHGRIVALDRDTGRLRWRIELGAIRHARLMPGRLLVGTPERLVAFDTETGREAWRLDIGPAPLAEITPLDDTTVAAQLHMGDLVALATADGTVRWRTQTGGVAGLSVRGDRVAVSGPTSVVALDRHTGRDLARLALTEVDVFAWTGDAITGVESTPAATVRPAHGRLFHLDPATGAVWRSARPAFGDAPIAAARDLVLGCSDDGVVHAYDARTGAGRWRAFVGSPPDPSPGPCELHVSEPDGIVLALGAAHRLSAFATGATPNRRAAARIVVTGKVFAPGSGAGIRVRVGDVWVRTGDDGRFSVAIRGGGTVTARVHPGDATRMCASSDPVSVPLRGSPNIRLRLVPDHCVCHACD